MPRYIIRRMIVPHCKRGPQVCADCRAANIEKTYILDIDPPLKGQVQRPIVDVQLDGALRSFEFDVVKGFGTEAEALAHAAEAGLRVLVVEE